MNEDERTRIRLNRLRRTKEGKLPDEHVSLVGNERDPSKRRRDESALNRATRRSVGDGHTVPAEEGN